MARLREEQRGAADGRWSRVIMNEMIGRPTSQVCGHWSHGQGPSSTHRPSPTTQGYTNILAKINRVFPPQAWFYNQPHPVLAGSWGSMASPIQSRLAHEWPLPPGHPWPVHLHCHLHSGNIKIKTCVARPPLVWVFPHCTITTPTCAHQFISL